MLQDSQCWISLSHKFRSPTGNEFLNTLIMTFWIKWPQFGHVVLVTCCFLSWGGVFLSSLVFSFCVTAKRLKCCFHDWSPKHFRPHVVLPHWPVSSVITPVVRPFHAICPQQAALSARWHAGFLSDRGICRQLQEPCCRRTCDLCTKGSLYSLKQWPRWPQFSSSLVLVPNVKMRSWKATWPPVCVQSVHV